MSEYHPGRRQNRRFAAMNMPILIMAVLIVLFSALILIFRGSFERLLPVVFLLGAAESGLHAVCCFARDDNRKRNMPGFIFSVVFGLFLVFLAVLSGVTVL